MKYNFLGTILGLALSATLVFSGCGGSSGDTFVEATGGGSGVASSSGGTSTGTTSVGLTGSTSTGGTTTTTGTGTGTTGTGTGTTDGGTDTGTTDGGTTGGGFTANVIPRTLYPGSGIQQGQDLNFATQFVRLGNRVYFIDGFNAGAARRLRSFNIQDALNNPQGQPALTVVAAGAASDTGAEDLFNAFGLATDGTNLFISTGFEAVGRIIRVSNLNSEGSQGTYTIIAQGLDALNPTFLTVVGSGPNQFVYWSTYASQAQGRVQRVRSSGVGLVETFVTGLNFPAGLAHNGSELIICENGGGTTGLVWRVPLNADISGGPLTTASPQVQAISAGATPFIRPFSVTHVPGSGFFFTEGEVIASFSSPPLSTPGSGGVRFLENSGTSAVVVAQGLTNCAGIAAASLGGGQVGVLFTESVALPNGRVLRLVVNTANPGIVTPTQVDTGLSFPLSVGIDNTTTPRFFSLTGYRGPAQSSFFKAYSP